MTDRSVPHFLRALAVGLGLLFFLSGSSPTLAQDPQLVLAFYYAWFDANTWDSGLVADQPAQRYTSADLATIQRHVKQAQAAGIDALIQSWYGPQEANNQTETNFRNLLDVAAAQGSYAAVDFETTGPFFPSRKSVTDALRYLLSVHALHPAYLRYQGKPVVFFWRQGRYSVDEWAAIRAEVDPNHESLWIAEGVDIAYQAVFDGHHLYSIAWSPDVGRTLTDWGFRVRRYEAQNEVDRLWVATVMPGYDDTRTDRKETFAVARRGGDYYRETWAAAVSSQPDWILITSFNEWVEGTMIEPSVTYGDLYLKLTQELAGQYKSEFGGSVPDRPESGAGAGETKIDESARPIIRPNEAVRVRAGPGTDYPRLGRLAIGEVATVIGRNAEGTWWQIEYASAEDDWGWVTSEFVTFLGDVDAVPVVNDVPKLATSTRVPAATMTRTPASLPTNTVTPTLSPVPTFTRTPIATLVPPPTFVTESPSSRKTQTAVRTVSPVPTATTTLRYLAEDKPDAPESLLWVGIGSLVGALGLMGVLWQVIRGQRG